MWEENKLKDIDKLKKFLNTPEVKEMINDNNFEDVYASLESKSYPINCNRIRSLTILLINADINALEYMNSIPSYCYDNLSIKILNIPNTIEKIGRCAFYNCRELENLFIPKSVKFIGDNCFTRCKSLKMINYEGTRREWMSIKAMNGTIPWGDEYWLKIKVKCSDGIWEKKVL